MGLEAFCPPIQGGSRSLFFLRCKFFPPTAALLDKAKKTPTSLFWGISVHREGQVKLLASLGWDKILPVLTVLTPQDFPPPFFFGQDLLFVQRFPKDFFILLSLPLSTTSSRHLPAFSRHTPLVPPHLNALVSLVTPPLHVPPSPGSN